jgi:hypothetical protein
MKTKILLFSFLSALLFAGCKEFDDTFTRTSVGKMSGDWHCYVEAYDLWFSLTTSNANPDNGAKLLMSDRVGNSGTFWAIALEVDYNLGDMTFGAPEGATNKWSTPNTTTMLPDIYDIIIRVSNGKITEGAVTLPSKTVSDRIEFTIAFEDDNPAFREYPVVGYRKSGFAEDVDVMSAIE